jgi:N-acyl-D-amino-acid deacylase
LKAGVYADIIVMNSETIQDKLDFLNPIQIPEGIECVVVNGTIVWRGKAHTGVKPGKVLRHQD